jgi:hypothetical protein
VSNNDDASKEVPYLLLKVGQYTKIVQYSSADTEQKKALHENDKRTGGTKIKRLRRDKRYNLRQSSLSFLLSIVPYAICLIISL